MTHLADILDPAALQAAIDAKHVKTVAHPVLPLTLYSYTDACTWDQGWNETTLACRGLIVNSDTGEVVARPFGKFFNHSQPGAPAFDLDKPLVVMDKVDGSLAISYPGEGGAFAIATRGSFASEQSAWANTFYQRVYDGKWEPNPAYTYLFEILYPENRIVLDYGDTRDLVLLGAVNIKTGRSVHVGEAAGESGWPGPTVDILPHASLREALDAAPRVNAEGFVLWDPETDERIKIKQEDYVLLHKFLTCTTEKHVWEVLSTGQDPAAHFSVAPDEFHVWLKGVQAELETSFADVYESAQAGYADVVALLDDEHGAGAWGRKEFAQAVSARPDKSLMFLMLDGKSIDSRIWQNLKPSGARTVRQAEDF